MARSGNAVYTIDDLGLQDDVRLLGKCTPEKVRDTLRRTDIFLLTSLSEGISNAMLEAMACELPVVATDSGGIREAVTDGLEGYIVPTRDVVALAQSLEILWQRPELRQTMGNAARQRVLKEFCLEQQTNAFLSFYRNALQTFRVK
jgi:colanic acid/amylovoran biosynthesis glycosyltransferase